VATELQETKNKLKRAYDDSLRTLDEEQVKTKQILQEQANKFESDRLIWDSTRYKLEKEMKNQGENAQQKVQTMTIQIQNLEEELKSYKMNNEKLNSTCQTIRTEFNEYKSTIAMSTNEKDEHIRKLEQDVRASKENTAHIIARMDLEMQEKAKETLTAIRINVQETQERHNQAMEEVAERLATANKTSAHQEKLWQEELEHMKKKLGVETTIAKQQNIEDQKKIELQNKEWSQKEKMYQDEKEEIKKKLDSMENSLKAMEKEKEEDMKIRKEMEDQRIELEQNRIKLEKENRELDIEVTTIKKLADETTQNWENEQDQVEQLKKQIEEMSNQKKHMVIETERLENGKERRDVEFEPLWSDEFEALSPIAVSSVPPVSPLRARDHGELLELRKQVEDYRAVIMKMKSDAVNLTPQPDPAQTIILENNLKEKDTECEELRKRNWELKQQNDRLAEERKQLMELSNTLRADNRLRQSVARERDEVTEASKEKIAAIETSLKDLTAYNLSFAARLGPGTRSPTVAWASSYNSPTRKKEDETVSQLVHEDSHKQHHSMSKKSYKTHHGNPWSISEISKKDEKQTVQVQNPRLARYDPEKEEISLLKSDPEQDISLIGHPISPGKRQRDNITSSQRITPSQMKTSEKLRLIQQRRSAQRDAEKQKVRNWNDNGTVVATEVKL